MNLKKLFLLVTKTASLMFKTFSIFLFPLRYNKSNYLKHRQNINARNFETIAILNPGHFFL